MIRSFLTYFIVAILLTSCGYRQHSLSSSDGEAKNNLPKSITLISTTPIKDQGKSDLCWVYGMLATIESEHIMKGDSINLSVAYIARMMLQEKALEYYFSKGKKKISMRGTSSMLIHYINKYGAEPYDSYEDTKDVNFNVLCKKVEHICKNVYVKGGGINELKSQLDELFDSTLGTMPAQQVHMLGAEYTPLEFAHSVCYPEEYVSLTSFTHHPFREYFCLEVPDNLLHDEFLNLPIDELMLHLRKAIERGHPVCWEGDISEPGFRQPKDNYVDVLPAQRNATQATRQKEYELLQTTDDHVMEIIGTFRKGEKRYYVCRNSWGTNWGNNGLIYLSEDYIRLKTIALYMSEEAFVYDKNI